MEKEKNAGLKWEEPMPLAALPSLPLCVKYVYAGYKLKAISDQDLPFIIIKSAHTTYSPRQ